MARLSANPIVRYGIIVFLLATTPLILWRLFPGQTGGSSPLSPRPLPPGVAAAGFTLSTARDPIPSAGLVMWLAYGDTYLTQPVASCNEAGSGNALGSPTGSELATADCDGLSYWLIAEGGRVFVQQGDVRQRDHIVASLDLPAGIIRVEGR